MYYRDRNHLSSACLGAEKILLMFYQEPCTECTHQRSTLANISEELEDVKICCIDVDKSPELVRAYSVIRVPTLIRISPTTLQAEQVIRQRALPTEIKEMMK